MTRLAIVAVLATSCAPAPDLPLARGPERSTTTTPPPVATTALPTPTTTSATAPAAPEVAMTGGGTNAIPAHVIACESGGSYTAQNPTSSASGKYQMIDSTFQGTEAGGASGYLSAKDAPPAVQDAAAAEVWDGGRGARNWAACL